MQRVASLAGRSFVRSAFTSRPLLPAAHQRAALGRPQTRNMVATTAPAETAAAAPKVIYRKDYAPPPYLIDTVDLAFNLNEGATTVTAKLAMTPNYGAASGAAPPPLVLNGRKDVKLVSLKVAGAPVAADAYEVADKTLTLKAPPAGAYELEIVTEIVPEKNSDLEGLYKSGGNYCTQCEAEGFRGITYFLDRPDVMAKYTTRIEADKAKYPVLLSNGNLVGQGDAANGRHFAVWEDPYPKPCYLFALVAGDLKVKEDTFRTKSGRDVALRIYTQPQYIDEVGFAMTSLKKSMKWDEDVFGLEYDLDLFNIVAVDDFNMGAMENKSLNIFNSRLVLATPESSTDGDYARIEGVVGHEYFHNWTGNRVTCRDWFQLTLKEGLTVFRDQEFSSDMNSRAVKRIEDAMRLRAAQFSEDSGPMAHPIRPDSYIKMDNFYTVTVYEKGAEIIRLYHTLLGADGFRKGMDLYFKRHDGQAVTCDDFLAAMSDANGGADLSGVGKWYSQAGTPQLSVKTEYDAAKATFTITTKQATPPTAGQPAKVPVMIPAKVGLIGPDGKDMPLRLQGSDADLGTTTVLRCDAETNTFVFTGVTARPVPSLLRDFSAPVKMTVEDQTDEDLVFLFANDSDEFNRWDAGQRLAMKLVTSLYAAAAKANANSADEASVAAACGAAGGVSEAFAAAFKAVVTAGDIDGSFKAMAVTLPSVAEIVDALPEADPVLAYRVRAFVNKQLAARLRPELQALVAANDDAPGAPFVFDAAASARRAAKNKALALLSTLGDESITEQLLRRFRAATNMTDRISALACLAETPGAARDAALAEYYEANKAKPLNMLKWLAVQAGSGAAGNLTAVKDLTAHPAFAITNPNSCYSLYLGFARSAPNFHAADGSGYEFLADAVLKLDKVNAIVASRVASAFTTYRQYDKPRQDLMRAQLARIAAAEGLTENVYEIVSKSLEQ